MWLCKFRFASECLFQIIWKCFLEVTDERQNVLLIWWTKMPNLNSWFSYFVTKWLLCDDVSVLWSVTKNVTTTPDAGLVQTKTNLTCDHCVSSGLIRDQVHWEDGRVSASRDGQSGSSFESYENTSNYSELLKASVDQSWFTVFLR